MKRLLPAASVLSLALFWSAPAHALTCEEIMNMVNVNVPTNIVVQTVTESGDTFSADDLRCLTNDGAPAEVISAVKSRMASAAAPVEDSSTLGTSGNSRTTGSSARQEFENDSTLGGGSTGGSRELTDNDSSEDNSKDPEKLEDAITAYNAKKPLTASLMLTELLQEGTYPDKESKILYYLGRSLYDLGMYHSAQYYFIEVLKKGTSNPYFKYALPKLVTIAKYTGDESDLMRIVAKIPPEEYPKSARNQLYYLLGMKYYNNNELSQARTYFDQISERSELYSRSQYLEGVIYNKQGKFKSAVRAFTAVAKYKGEAATQQELDDLNNLRDLALMNVARIYYSIERFDDANAWYTYVGHQSPYWAQAEFESSWANFMRGDLNLTLGQLLTVQSPYYMEHEFLPEAYVLKALTFFQLCKLEDITRILGEFEGTYKPIHEEMKAFLQQYATDEGKKLADQAFDRYFGQDAAPTVLPKSLFGYILRNQEFSGLVDHLALLDREETLIDEQKTQWKDGVGTQLHKIISEDRERLKQRAGRVMLQEMAGLSAYLGDLLTQSQIIKFEVADANHVRLTQAASGELNLLSQSASRIDYAVDPSKIFWPFNGEFWQDELGYYRFTEKSECNAH